MMNCTDTSKKVKDVIYSIRLKSSTRPNLSSCWKCISEVVKDFGDIVFGVRVATIVTNAFFIKLKQIAVRLLILETKI